MQNLYQKAEVAQKSGWFDDEIVPVTTTVKDRGTGETRQIVVNRDDGIRHGTTAESLSKIRAAFPQWAPSATTGGKRIPEYRRGGSAIDDETIKGRVARATDHCQVLGAMVVGLEPRIMGIVPSLAIPKIMGKFGLQ